MKSYVANAREKNQQKERERRAGGGRSGVI
jgi:hypothetical protein